MVNYTCAECQRSFVATSFTEAEDAYNEQVRLGRTDATSFEDAVDTGEVAYARFCPYCGSAAIMLAERG